MSPSPPRALRHTHTCDGWLRSVNIYQTPPVNGVRSRRPVVPLGAYLGKASKQYVFLVSGKATRKPDMRGEWRMTAAHSYREARSTVGTVPML